MSDRYEKAGAGNERPTPAFDELLAQPEGLPATLPAVRASLPVSQRRRRKLDIRVDLIQAALNRGYCLTDLVQNPFEAIFTLRLLRIAVEKRRHPLDELISNWSFQIFTPSLRCRDRLQVI